jgi:hypothetical protein
MHRELATGNGGIAKRAMNGGAALDNYRVVSRAEGDCVVARRPVLFDDAGATKSDRIVAATDRDSAVLAFPPMVRRSLPSPMTIFPALVISIVSLPLPALTVALPNTFSLKLSPPGMLIVGALTWNSP